MKPVYAIVAIIIVVIMTCSSIQYYSLSISVNSNVIERNGVIVRYFTYADRPYRVVVEAKIPQDSTLIHWSRCTYLWVSRRAIFSRWDSETQEWIYKQGFPTLWGDFGSRRLYASSSLNGYYLFVAGVDFNHTRSWTGGVQEYTFESWSNKGTISIGGISIVFELPISLETPAPPNSDESDFDNVTPDELPPPPETLRIELRPQQDPSILPPILIGPIVVASILVAILLLKKRA